MKKRYLRFNARTSPVKSSPVNEIIIDISPIVEAERHNTAIYIETTKTQYDYFFENETEAKTVYNKIWEILIQEDK